KWAKIWVEEKIFTPDLENSKNPYYSLFMFPYPSAEGLHIGNFYAFISVDVMAKYKKLKGFDVFEPIGWDAFGIHSENYALKIGEMPSKMLKRTIKNFRNQLKEAGLSCDWTREINTTTPEYYKWTQWIFVKLFEKGLAYQKEAMVNWCPDCKTVLADEQIEAEGLCERCKATVEKRKMKQWFFKITEYAERLLNGLEKIDWSEITKSAQKNWIGKSEGVNFKEKVKDLNIEFEVYDSIPQTFLAQTFTVIAPEHPLVPELVKGTDHEKPVMEFVEEIAKKKAAKKFDIGQDMKGIFTGRYVENPFGTGDLPIWVASFVLADYGTGIVNCSAHDERDFVFAKKYNIPLKVVLLPKDEERAIKVSNLEEFYREPDGIIQEPEEFKGMKWDESRKAVIDYIEEKGFGNRSVNYKLRDWCISRQRYWGPPIPVVYCKKCGTVAVPEKDLPVELPELKKGWEPAGNGKGPLANVESFIKTKCPKCGGPAEREADVMDNFLDSAWYFFRYISPKEKKEIFNKKLGKKWLPVDIYIGGNEHAVLHLMYTRFITMFFHDLGLADFDNPFKKFRANGMILKDGKKMSKSEGNVVNPEEYGRKLGYDALKTYLLFLGPLSEDRSFSDEGIMGARHWAERVFNLSVRVHENHQDDENLIRKLHKTIKAVSDDMENQKYNTAIAKLMEITNALYANQKISYDVFKKFLIIVSIFLPALAEELWSESGNKESIFKESWPEYDLELIKDEEIELVVQVNGKLRDRIKVSADISEDEAKKIAMESEKIKNYIS
ncbi:MAG: leucine--tRNA ligase, partial [Patescibacteria group bacterium]